ncbi:MAG: HAAS signaling domain-containing protein, partial [Candidatus Thorarchaeota archaeon]
MSKEEAEKLIEDYINTTRRVLPSSFETEDLLDDLRTHILDALQDKIAQRPSEEILVLVREVLEHLGTPEEIAKEYTMVGVADSEDSDDGRQWSRKLLRLAAAIIISVIAAAIVSYVTEGAI